MSVILSLILIIYGVWWLVIHTKPGFDNIKVSGYVKDKFKPINEVNIKITYWFVNDNYIAVDSTHIIKTNKEGYYKTTINNAESMEIEAQYNNDTIVKSVDLKSNSVLLNFNFMVE